MKLGAYIYFNKDLKKITIADSLPVNFKGIKVGEVTKTYVKDGKMWVDIQINKDIKL